jgi:CobQ-like glutamine amidotransferase family enzyme
MRQRLAWRGLEAEVTEVPVGVTADFTKFDLIFIGGGQDFEQEVLLPDLRAGKDRELKSAIADGKTVLAICGGYQMLGNYYKTWDGQQCDFIGAIDLCTVGSKERMIGNFAFECGAESGGSTVVGFENHSGKTYLGDGVQPLGTILAGGGNNGSDGTEGVRHLNVFGTYSHGPVLPKNPAFCDHILETAFRRKDDSFRLPPLDDKVENAAHDAMVKRVTAQSK